jgi:O-methyltransferase
MNDAFLAQLEDELLGVRSRPSLLQRLAAVRVPVRSIPKILLSIGARGVAAFVRRSFTDPRSLYEEGRALPPLGMTMIGRKRLRNIRFCIEQILQDRIQGDFIETGVWRGGAAIYMRAVLKSRGVKDRTVWVADSFQGIPSPDPRYRADTKDILHCWSNLAVSRKEVESHFLAYGLLDDRVRFLPGWFEDSLKTFPKTALALLRIDCDLYGSTLTVLTELYDRVAKGGYVIVDDYGEIPACRLAVEDFRRAHKICDSIIEIDHTGIYWIKTGSNVTNSVP